MSENSGYIEATNGGKNQGTVLADQEWLAPNVTLPSCFNIRADGVFVDASNIEHINNIADAVNSIFSAGLLFHELNYENLIKLIYDFDSAIKPVLNASTLIRIATSVLPFAPERHALYRAVKIDSGQAEYYFEPVFVEKPADVFNTEKRLEAASLNFDEFVAFLWEKGVRFGIEVDVVRAAIKNTKAARHVIAKCRPAIPGIDAGIQELAPEIHRSDAPKEKSNGRLDLAQFKNRFPQIKKGVRLLRKTPRQFGLIGFEVSGAVIQPAIPKEFDLGVLVGEGTNLLENDDGQFIVSTEDGFLNLDSESNKISIGKKIVNRDGVSGRTTGNLKLNAGDFEEFGEVQEKRVVEGNNITIHGVVFGNIVSRGGEILLNNNLMGGTVTNKNGDIHLKSVASSAVVQAFDGDVIICRAEGSVITGKTVTIDQACNCEIVAEHVIIQQAEGCIIAAKNCKINSSAPRKQTEMQLLALVPELAKYEQTIKSLKQSIEENNQLLLNKKKEADEIPEIPDVKKYITIITKVKNKELTLTSEQTAAVQKLAQKIAPHLKQAAKIDAEIQDIEKMIVSINEQIADTSKQKSDAIFGICCSVDNVMGDTFLRIMPFNAGANPLYRLPIKDIKSMLRTHSQNGKKILTASKGTIEWRYEPTKES